MEWLVQQYVIRYWPRHYKLILKQYSPLNSALDFLKDTKAIHLWWEAYWSLLNPITRTNRGFRSILPILANLGLTDLVTRYLETMLKSETPGIREDYAMALAEAARNGHIEIVRKLLSIRDYRQMDLQDVLIAALSSCNEAVMEALISYVARMPKFEWPSELLCRLSQFGLGTEIEKVLSSAALLETALTIRNRTPLYEVARQGHLEVLKIILKNKNSLTEKSDTDGRTPLHSACARGHATTAQLLLDSGADCNAVDDYEHNALIIACFNGQHEVVKVLTKAGCNVNYRKEDEWPPLLYAIQYGLINCARLLLDSGADPIASLVGKQLFIGLSGEETLILPSF